MELFKLLGKIAIENAEARRALKEVSQEGQETESKLGKTFAAIGNGAVKMGKIIGAGMVAGAGAVAGLVTKSVQSYAEYEQLVGGVDTLFKESSGKVQEYAENAYKTAGMSANQYMETVTSFSASLLQSLDGDTNAAAEKADQAITDMSDNANKMGTDITMIQNAYQGFAKQNYTMLDNLKLGYGGTKEEMQRLLDDAQKISGIKYDISSYADVVDAIHVMQEEMGIAGTTAKEASSTISGSISSMKSAWSNLLTAMSTDDLPFDEYVTKFVDSVSTVAQNIIPRVQQALEGVVSLVDKLAPIIIEKIPGLVSALLPALVEAATGLVNSLVAALPGVITALMDVLPMLIDGFMSIVDALIGALPTIIETIVAALPTIIPQLIDAAVSLFMMLVEMLPQIIQPLIDALPTIIVAITDALLSNLPVLLSGVGQLIVALAAAIPQILGALWDAIKGIFSLLGEKILGFFEPVKTAISNAWQAMGNVPGLAQLKTMVENVWKSIKDFITTYINAVKNIVTTVWNSIKNVISTVLNSIKNVIKTAWEAVKTIISNVMKLISSVLKGDWEGVKSAISNILNAIKSVIKSIWDGIKNTISSVLNGIKSVVSSVWSGIKSVVSSALNTIKSVVSSVWNGIKSSISKVLNGIKTTVSRAFKDMASAGKDLAKGIWNGISNSLDWIKGKIKGWVGSVTKFIKKLFGIKSPSTVMRDEVGRQLAAGVAVGIEQNTSKVQKAAEEMNQKVLDAAQKRIDDYKVYNDMTLAEEAGFWDEVRQQIAEGTDAIIKADQKYLEAKKSVDEQVLDAEKTFSEKMVSAQKTLQDTLDNIAKKVTDRQKSIMDSFDLFASFNPEESGFDTSTELLLGLDAQINALEKYNSLIDNLEARIGGSALLDELKSMGVDSADKLQHIANMSDSDLQMYSKKYDEKLSLAGRMATEDTAEERAKLTEEAYRVYAEAQKAAIDEIDETYNLIGVEIQYGTESLVSTLTPCMENIVEAFTTPLGEIRDAWSNTFGDLATGLGFSTPELSKDSVVYSINSETADGSGNTKAETGTLSDVFASIVEQKNLTKKLIEMLAKFFPELIEAFDVDIFINDRVLAAELAPAMDIELGRLNGNKERGR
jgi:phage-related protein